ncbi:hypothetical protein CEXT_80231 [Caerostris extrusa]|uniref:Uncharacterized protein n=1 Tax=Caerostris extrusa TaxID=172846 RepID=A0AAV4N8S4_CAEEX|nr:hypothetical protein CEXT_80231 [Caerostris extrusa]
MEVESVQILEAGPGQALEARLRFARLRAGTRSPEGYKRRNEDIGYLFLSAKAPEDGYSHSLSRPRGCYRNIHSRKKQSQETK